ncbi:MAG: efflux RND transporter permease subunit [Leptospiraceae bacterium]|nr:efflux RND transporter permease subunit [Leptospiraceae bacterium]
MRGVIKYFLDKSIFLNLLTVLILLVGLYKGMCSLNREAFPNVNFDIVTITTIYPGASPSEVEKLVTKPIEESIKSVDGIKEFRSGSIENRSGIVVTIDPNVKDTQKVVDDIKSAVDRTEDLPEDAKKPLVQEITSGRNPVIEIHVGIKEKDGKPLTTEKEFREKVKILEEMLLDIPEVARITRKGYRDAEMHVDLNPQKMDVFQLSAQQVINALRGKNISFPGGNLSDQGKEAAIRTVGEFDTPVEIEDVFVRSNDAGRSVKLKDVAKVKEDYADKVYIEKINGLYAIGLVVIKKEKADAITLVEKTRKVKKEFEEKYKESLTFTEVNDISKYIKRRLDVLISNGVGGFILVVGSLFFFLGWRISLMVALGLPLAVAMTLISLDYFGMTLNLISMMGLIIVVGMLVDDAIVISENIYRYIEMGEDVLESCIKGTAEVVAPVTATVTTTCAAFGPMLFMTGIFGKFVYSIPMVVIIALLSSLFESLFILPTHVYDINKGNVHKGEIKEEGNWYIRFRDNFYKPVLSRALLNKTLTITIFILAWIASLVALKIHGKFKLFPGGVEIFMAKVTAPVGLTLEETERFAQVIEMELAKFPKTEIENYSTRIGITQKDPNDPFTKRGKNFGMIMVYLTPEEQRKMDVEEVISQLRARTNWMMNETALKAFEEKQAILNKTKVSTEVFDTKEVKAEIPKGFEDLKGKLILLDYEKMQGGPPVGKPVAIEIRGDDFATLKKIAEEYKEIMKKVPGVIDIGDDYYDGKDEIRITIDESLAARAGVSVQQIALAINTAYQGTVATSIKRADEEIDVRVRFPENYRTSIKSLDRIYVTNLLGNLIPISRMTKYIKGPGIASINHLDGKRLITATANLDESTTQPAKANAEIKKLAGNLIDKYPGYRMRFGGENKDTEESMASLGRAFLVAFLIIFLILSSLFRSLVQPFIVMSAIPFSIMGVIIAFVTHNQYFSFLSMIGIIGLSGIVVNDSIVLVDFANQLRKEKPHLSTYHLLLETGLVRLRPVLLTTITTVLGILPTAYGIGGSDPFLKPMALAIGWGLAFATLLTLVLVPVLYKTTYDAKAWFKSKIGKKESIEVSPKLASVTSFTTDAIVEK